SSGGNIFHGQPISTVLTAIVFIGSNVIETQEELEAAFGESAAVNWYNGSTLLESGMSFNLSSESNKETITARLET
ncbi:MAG: hypothetical protein ACI4Q5_01525, partial [Porcipelethomonas sp.]